MDFVDVAILNTFFAAYLVLIFFNDYGRKYWLSIVIVSSAVALFWVTRLVRGLIFGDVLKWIRQDWTELITQALLLITFAGVPLFCTAVALRLKASNVPAFSTSLTSLLASVKRMELELKRESQGSPSLRQLLGRTLVLTSIGGMIAAVVLFQLSLLFLVDPTLGALFGKYSNATLLSLPVFALTYGFGRRISQPEAGQLLERDRRSPIVFLRSFRDDRAAVRTKLWTKRLLYFGFGGKVRLEEVIADDIGRFGPFVAIGQPGENLPLLGASRAYVKDLAWKDEVLGWLDQTRLIILIGGTTQGVLWELQRIVEAGHARRLLILLPPTNAEERTERWHGIAGVFEGASWKSALADSDIEDALALCPHDKGRVTLIRGNTQQAVDYELALRFAVYTMFMRSEA
jgi:hypothetical protein